MNFLSLRRDKKRIKEEINTIDPYDAQLSYLNLAKSIKTNVDIKIRIADNVIPNSKSDSIVEMIAKGIVWVSPVRFPANTKVAPNSETLGLENAGGL